MSAALQSRMLAATKPQPFAQAAEEAEPSCSFDTIERYWRDPDFAAALDAEGAALSARFHAEFDKTLAPARARQEAAWERDEEIVEQPLRNQITKGMG